MTRSNNATIRYICVLALIFASCATQKPPEGGPVDTIPPEIIETYPEKNTTNFSGTEIMLRFSEYVDRQTAQSSIHISPPLLAPPEYDWSGKKLTIIIPEKLRDNTTYVVSVGTDVADIRNRNKMSQSFSLAFSTGDSIDQGFLRGEVIDLKPEGISIFGYRLQDRNSDTLNPSKLPPDYLVQTGSDGKFVFQNIAPGTYRFIAVRDKIKDNIYDVQLDDFGLLAKDEIVLSNDSLRPPVQFLLATEDTTRPEIQTLEAIDAHHFSMKLSEALVQKYFPTHSLHVRDSISNVEQEIIACIPNEKRPSQYFVTVADPMHEGKYIVHADSLQDAAGNIGYVSQATSFTSSAETDTARPQLVSSFPTDKASSIPTDSMILLHFNDAVVFEHSYAILKDSTSREVKFALQVLSTSSYGLSHETFRLGERYSVCLDLSSIRKVTNNRSAGDSIFCFYFTTRSEKEVGSLEGVVSTVQPGSAPINVELHDAGKGTGNLFRTIAKQDGAYAFPQIPEGRYVTSAYIDANNNGKYDPGRPFPFKPAERFGNSRDTLRVRAQWNTKSPKLVIP